MGDSRASLPSLRSAPWRTDDVWDLYAGIGETTGCARAGRAHRSRAWSRPPRRGGCRATRSVGAAPRRPSGGTCSASWRRPDLVVTNPPRTGMDARRDGRPRAAAPERVVYISCDPATLARDLTRLPGVPAREARAFDLFPQTAHVETVAVLERRHEVRRQRRWPRDRGRGRWRSGHRRGPDACRDAEPVPGTPVRQLLLDGRSDGARGRGGRRGGRWAITRAGERCEVEVVDERTRHIRSLAGGGEQPEDRRRSRPRCRASWSGSRSRPGQSVAAGAGVVVLEAMKMENELRAAAAGRGEGRPGAAGEAVEKGQVLVEFESAHLTHLATSVYLVSLFRFGPTGRTRIDTTRPTFEGSAKT